MLKKSLLLSAVAIAIVLSLLFNFQNCAAPNFSAQKSNSSNISDESLLGCETTLCEDLNNGNASCSFNGQTIPHGGTTTAYLTSSGSNCDSEVRTCNNGALSGSYTYASCVLNGPNSCLFNGLTILHGSSVTAYLNSSGTCSSESRTCNDGVLSGSYAYASCTPSAPVGCLFNGVSVASGDVVTAYQNSTVPYGSTCVSEIRLCTNGSFNGSFAFASCSISQPQSCLFNGQTIPHGASVSAFQSSSVSFGETCQSQSRTCDNGALSGTYAFASCEPQTPATCLFNGTSIAHGQNVVAYQNSTVPYGQSCQSQNRTCTNGVLSGSFVHPSCNVEQPATCTFNGTSVASGQSVVAFFTSTVPYGQTCQSENRTCDNGALSGTYSYGSCQVAAPQSCLFNGQTIAHGGSVIGYSSSTVPYGQSCSSVQQTRVCTNGVLSGSAQYASCEVNQPASCLFNGTTVVHGDSIHAFPYATAPYGGACTSETRVCDNGVLSGSAAYATCALKYLWINVPGPAEQGIPSTTWTHASVCATAGLTPAADQGEGICASGEDRPLSAPNIIYKYGTWGNTRIGGFPFGAYCYHATQKHDNDRTDITVAYLCEKSSNPNAAACVSGFTEPQLYNKVSGLGVSVTGAGFHREPTTTDAVCRAFGCTSTLSTSYCADGRYTSPGDNTVVIWDSNLNKFVIKGATLYNSIFECWNSPSMVVLRCNP